MAKADGTNGAKIGRHSRNPSSKLQSIRSARNKARRIARAVSHNGKTSVEHTCPRHPAAPASPSRVTFPNELRTDVRPSVAKEYPLFLHRVEGKILEISLHLSDCLKSRADSRSGEIFRLDPFGALCPVGAA